MRAVEQQSSRAAENRTQNREVKTEMSDTHHQSHLNAPSNPHLKIREGRGITVAVAGNPNSGKSTLINATAGTRLQVGNWPGVTVEKKAANFEHEDRKIRLIDLPGTYSLSPSTQEERIARDYLIHERPDVIIDVVDATNLERNLYLTIQFLELDIPIVIALNIYDEAEAKGYEIDTKALEEMLGVIVVPTVATKKKGLDDLLEAVIEAADTQNLPKRLNYGEDIESAAKSIEDYIKGSYPVLAERYPLRWLVFKLMEGDNHVMKDVNISDISFIDRATGHIKKAHEEDIESIMADERYAFSSGVTHEVLKKKGIRRIELTEKIDSIALNRFLGIPIFLAAMSLVFKFTFDISTLC